MRCQKLCVNGMTMFVCGAAPRTKKMVDRTNFPISRVELLQARCTLVESRACKACGAQLEFWKSSQKNSEGKFTIFPMEVRPELNWQLDTHWRYCPRAAELRKAKAPDTGQKDLFK